MQNQRPVNLDLLSLKYPPMAIVSILHRISGIVLFLFMPFMIYGLYLSLVTQGSFDTIKASLQNCLLVKTMLWGFVSALVYHIFAGIRHLIMDFGIGESLASGRRTAVLVLCLSLLSILFLGLWIYG